MHDLKVRQLCVTFDVRSERVSSEVHDLSGQMRDPRRPCATNTAVESVAVLQPPMSGTTVSGQKLCGCLAQLRRPSRVARCFGKERVRPSGLVNMSAVLSSLLTYLGLMVPSATNSRILSSRRWMCFDLAWLTGSWARLIAPELSMRSSVVPGGGKPNSVSRPRR
eukprot:1571301-Pleurochrysis_carterae.AAC.1